MTEHKIFIIVAGKENTSAIFKKVNAGAKKLGEGTKGLGKAFGGLKEKTSSLIGPMAKLAGGAAMIGVAKASISASLGAERYRKSLEGLAGGAKEATSFIEGIQGASLGTISKMDAMAISSKALSLKVVDNAQNMKDLTEVAITLGRAQGLSATQSVDDLTTAIGRQSPLILDNLGITLKASEAKQIYADSLNKTVAQLTAVESSQAFANAALIKGQEVAAKLGGVQLDNAAKTEKMNAQLSDMAITLGDALVPAFLVFVDLAISALDVLGPLLDTFAEMTAGLDEMSAAADEASASADTMGASFTALKDDGASTGEALEEMASRIDGANTAIDEMSGLQKFAAGALGKTGEITHTVRKAQISLNKEIASGSGTYKDYVKQINTFNASTTNAGSQIGAMTQAQFKWQKSWEAGAGALDANTQSTLTARAAVIEQFGTWTLANHEAWAAQNKNMAATQEFQVALEASRPAWITANRVTQGFSDLQVEASGRMREREGVLGSLNQATEASSAVIEASNAAAENRANIDAKSARVAEMQAASIVAANTALEAKRQKNIATAEAEVGLASSMVDVTEAALAQTFIQGLDAESMGLTAYQAAVENIQLSFGLATPESIALSRGITQGLEAANSGALAYKDLDQFIVALKEDAADGTVDFDALSRTFASSTAQADFLGQRITATGDAIVGNVSKTESLIAAEEGLTGVTRQAKDQMAGFGDILPNIASGGELWTNTIDGSSRALDAGQATAQQWESTMAGLDSRMMSTGESLLSTGEKIQAVNAVFEDGARPIEDSTQGLDDVGEAHAAARVPVDEFAGAVGEIPAGMDAAANAAPPAAEGVVDFGIAAGEAVDPVTKLANAASGLGDAMSGIPSAGIPTTGGGGGTNGAESFAGGGTIPGGPHQAVPIIGHGTERVVPVGQSVGPSGPPVSGGNTTSYTRQDTIVLQGSESVNTFMRMRQREDRLARHRARM